jgi:hypothetical protein
MAVEPVITTGRNLRARPHSASARATSTKPGGAEKTGAPSLSRAASYKKVHVTKKATAAKIRTTLKIGRSTSATARESVAQALKRR